MNKTVSRLLIFFIGIPLVLAIVILPYRNHLALHLLVCLVSAAAAMELHSVLSHTMQLPPKPLVTILSALIPVAAALESVFPALMPERFTGGIDFLTCILILCVLAVLVYEVFSARSFEASNARMAGSVFIILYAGYLITFLQRLCGARTADGTDATVPLVAAFLLMVFLCDSLAWFFGILLGKGNRGFIKASPNKSIAGFIGGFLGSVLAGGGSYLIWPSVFGPSVARVVAVAVAVAFCAITGDLAESIFKRSAGVKDSGSIIPGRGGLLDSIDSILLAAPVFYILSNICFGPFGA